MYKRFRTINGKRMKVRMTDEEVVTLIGFRIALLICGLFLAALIWGAI